MADFSPFAGVRYAGIQPQGTSAELAALVAPPYDVIDDDQRAALEATDEHNSVRLILPRDVTADGDRYARAAETFAQWRAERRARGRSRAPFLRVPHGVHRSARRPPPHPRRDRRR